MDIAFFFIGDLSWSCRKQGTVAKMRRASFYPLYYFTLLLYPIFSFLLGPSSIVADVEKGTVYALVEAPLIRWISLTQLNFPKQWVSFFPAEGVRENLSLQRKRRSEWKLFHNSIIRQPAVGQLKSVKLTWLSSFDAFPQHLSSFSIWLRHASLTMF